MGSLGDTEVRNRLYIAGGPGGSSIAPPVREFIAKSFGKNWTMEFLQLESAAEVMEVYRRPEFKGGVVTMPHKCSIISMVDEVDKYVHAISACNLVYPSPEGRLCGTNTDWIGVSESILSHAKPHLPGSIAMVYGAGGAARAAIYALLQVLECSKLYVINRDKKEVEKLAEDVSNYCASAFSDIVHIQTVEQASSLSNPHYIVSTIPDGAAVTESEIEARKILTKFLSRDPKGLLVDVCYHPLKTSNIQLAQRNGWKTVSGLEVAAHQLKTQWSFFGSLVIPHEAPFLLEALAEQYDSPNMDKH